MVQNQMALFDFLEISRFHKFRINGVVGESNTNKSFLRVRYKCKKNQNNIITAHLENIYIPRSY